MTRNESMDELKLRGEYYLYRFMDRVLFMLKMLYAEVKQPNYEPTEDEIKQIDKIAKILKDIIMEML